MIPLEGYEADTLHVALTCARSWLDLLHVRANDRPGEILSLDELGRLQVARLEVEAGLAVIEQALAGGPR